MRVLIVEPGGFRSNFAAAVNMAKADIPKEYQGTITDQMLTAVTMMTPEMVKLFPGDVEKGYQAIFDVVTKSGRVEGMDEFVRNPIGSDIEGQWEIKIDGSSEDFRWDEEDLEWYGCR